MQRRTWARTREVVRTFGSTAQALARRAAVRRLRIDVSRLSERGHAHIEAERADHEGGKGARRETRA